ncbi:hypothetical protein TNCV_825181 [Trichonephila clavipes]|nr:hypothetical protein TNCV_825181 [Trichonephila clavipes]
MEQAPPYGLDLQTTSLGEKKRFQFISRKEKHFVMYLPLEGTFLEVSSAFAAGGTLNTRRTTSPLVRLVEGEERWEVPDHSQGVLPQNWGGTKQHRTVTCRVLKANA